MGRLHFEDIHDTTAVGSADVAAHKELPEDANKQDTSGQEAVSQQIGGCELRVGQEDQKSIHNGATDPDSNIMDVERNDDRRPTGQLDEQAVEPVVGEQERRPAGDIDEYPEGGPSVDGEALDSAKGSAGEHEAIGDEPDERPAVGTRSGDEEMHQSNTNLQNGYDFLDGAAAAAARWEDPLPEVDGDEDAGHEEPFPQRPDHEPQTESDDAPQQAGKVALGSVADASDRWYEPLPEVDSKHAMERDGVVTESDATQKLAQDSTKDNTHVIFENLRAETPEQAANVENNFCRRRVDVVEAAAAAGEYGGEPLYFLASVERETGLIVDDGLARAFHDGTYDSRVLQEVKEEIGLSPPEDLSSFAVLTEEQRSEQESHYRQMAREYISGLTSHSQQEENQRQHWLDNIDSFTTEDIINFRLYQEFSVSTLGAVAPPKSADYDTVADFGDQHGWLEFRFGNGGLQTGWYDNPGTVEYRLNPCSPSELLEREEIIHQRYIEIAAEHGAVVMGKGRHINLSAYSPHDEDGQSSLNPLIGLQPDRQDKTVDIISGLSAAIEDGAWMRSATANDRLMFGETAAIQKWEITTNRDSLRVQNDYIELRDPRLMGSTAHGLLWMIAGMSYGLERGMDNLAKEGHVTADTQQQVVALRTESFDKGIDLQLQRALEKSKMSEDGLLTLEVSQMLDRGSNFARDALGDALHGDQALEKSFAYLFIRSLEVSDNGQLKFNEASFKYLCETYKDIITNYSTLIQPAITDAARRYVERDAVRVDIQNVIHVRPHFPGRTPDEWQGMWANSPIVRRMFGDAAVQYGKELFEIAADHYEPVDLSDNEQVKGVLKELIERRRKM